MRVYLDAEYDGHDGPLISLAMVPADGYRPWYEVVEPGRGGWADPWVLVNVLPVLGRQPLRPLIFRSSLQQYALSLGPDPEFVCDWHADAAHLCRMMAGPDYGSSLNVEFTVRVIVTPPGEPVSSAPHNALADAEALRDWCEAKRAAAHRWP